MLGAAHINVPGVPNPKIGKKLTHPAQAHTSISPRGKIVIHTPKTKDVKKKDKLANVIFKRHEADEATAAKRQFSKGSRTQPQALTPHGHISYEVLDKEKKLTDVAGAHYKKRLKKGASKDVMKLRTAKYGEYDELKRAKDMAKAQGIKKGWKNIDKAIGKEVGSAFKNNIELINQVAKTEKVPASSLIKGELAQQMKHGILTKKQVKAAIAKFKAHGVKFPDPEKVKK